MNKRAFGNTGTVRIGGGAESERQSVSHFGAPRACRKSNAFERTVLVLHALGDDALAPRDDFVATELMAFYAHFARVDEARHIFVVLCEKARVSGVVLNAMMTLLVRCGRHREALDTYDTFADRKTARHLRALGVSHLLGVTACARIGDVAKGRCIWQRLKNTIQVNIHLKNSFFVLFWRSTDASDWRVMREMARTE